MGRLDLPDKYRDEDGGRGLLRCRLCGAVGVDAARCRNCGALDPLARTESTTIEDARRVLTRWTRCQLCGRLCRCFDCGGDWLCRKCG